MCMDVWMFYLHICLLHSFLVHTETRGDIRAFGTGITDGYEVLYESQGVNTDPLKECS